MKLTPPKKSRSRTSSSIRLTLAFFVFVIVVFVITFPDDDLIDEQNDSNAYVPRREKKRNHEGERTFSLDPPRTVHDFLRFYSLRNKDSPPASLSQIVYYGAGCNGDNIVGWFYDLFRPTLTHNCVTPRPRRCQKCFPHDFPTIIRPRSCEDGPWRVVFAIVSRPEGIERRAGIRATWAKSARRASGTIVFLTGTGSLREVQEALEVEARVHGDVLQTDFIDSYFNLTVKSVTGLSWITSHCVADFVVKIDDDTFVNVDVFVSRLPKASNATFIGGTFETDVEVIRKPSRYAVTHNEWPFLLYPTFCYGVMLVFSSKAARAVVEASPNVPFFKLEDVYLTGLVGNDHLNIKPVFMPEVERVIKGDICAVKSHIAAFDLGDRDIVKTWNKLQHGCSDAWRLRPESFAFLNFQQLVSFVTSICILVKR